MMRVILFGTLLAPMVACGKLATDSSSSKSATAASTGTGTAVGTGGKTAVHPTGHSDDADCELAPSQANAESSRRVMTCEWKSSCTDGGGVQLEAGIDPESIKVTGQGDAREYTGAYDSTSGELRFEAGACPVENVTVVVQYAASEGVGDDSDNPYADCSGLVQESFPPRIRLRCVWKKACEETVYLPLGSHAPDSTTIEMQREGAEAPPISVPVDGDQNAAVVTVDQCPGVGTAVVFNYTAKTAKQDSSLVLYAHPCGNGDPINRTCPEGVPSVDVVGTSATCASLGLELGDSCSIGLDKCEYVAAQACENAPTEVISSASYLFCRSEPFDENTQCPISARSAKRDIEYLSGAERARLAAEIKDLKLARYHYAPNASRETGPQLGFIIDDKPDLSFLTSDQGHVNLYGYVSALVALVQEQQQRIDTMERQLMLETSKKNPAKARSP